MRGQSLDTPPDLHDFPVWFEGTEFALEFQPIETGNGESYVLYTVNLFDDDH